MGIVTEKWNIAYRARKGFRAVGEPYVRLRGTSGGWYADPFLFEHGGALWLFAEFFSYQTRRGSIAVFRYDDASGSFLDGREIIAEPFHMSYPQVFREGDDVYMLPETEEANALILYKAASFPYEWKRERVLAENVKLVDTTLIPGGRAIAQRIGADGAEQATEILSYEDGAVTFTPWELRPLRQSRPGGFPIREDGNVLMTAQDCRDTYGGALEFYDLSDGKTAFVLSPENTIIRGEKSAVLGIHTYNACDALEVIDYKINTVSLNRIARRAASLIRGK